MAQGTHYRADRDRYQAEISINGHRKRIGYFKTQEEAHAKYLELRANHPVIRTTNEVIMKDGTKQLPSSGELSKIYTYNPATGILSRTSTGKPQTNIANGTKYYRTKLQGTWFRVHRVIWKLLYDEEPIVIDHKDRDTFNNRPGNLRSGTPSQSTANRALLTSKHPIGVYKNRNKYYARISNLGVTHNLGSFNTPEEAHEAYKKKHLEIYGEFSSYV